MKNYLLLFLSIFIFWSCSQLDRQIASQNEVRHVVFDIDWTIVSEIQNSSAKHMRNKRIIEVMGKHYYINDGLEELIQEILQHPEIKISFYSGGDKLRNHELLSKIKISDGRSLADISYKILSFDDLVRVENSPPNASFSEKYKKDLTKISKNLDNLIMFDDTQNFALDGVERQSEKVFFLGTALEYFETYAEAENKTGKYVPKNYEEWLQNKNKLYTVREIFRDAYAEVNSNPHQGFAETLKKSEGILDKKPINTSSDSCSNLVNAFIAF